MFLFDKDKFPFYISTALWLRKYDGFDFSRDHIIEMSRDFLGGAPHSDSASLLILLSLEGRGPCECGDKTF